MTSDNFLTSQVGSFNKEEIVGSRHKRRLLFCLCLGLFFDVWFQVVQVGLRLCSQGYSELLVSCLHLPSVETPDVCHHAQPKGCCALKWLLSASVPSESFSPSMTDAC